MDVSSICYRWGKSGELCILDVEAVALDAGLRFRGPCYSAAELADFAFDVGEVYFGLRCVRR
jgi:hypothetical protein